MSVVETHLLTAQEFFELGDSLGRAELIRGKVVPMNPPGWWHGNIGSRICHYLEAYLEDNDIGRSATLDSGVVTEHDPDTVRGADVSYYSYARLPADDAPADYPVEAPEIIWEVVSPSDRWKNVEEKVQEYLQAGVLLVCVVDSIRECTVTYYPDRPEQRLVRGEVWTASEILPGFEMPLDKLFRKRRQG